MIVKFPLLLSDNDVPESVMVWGEANSVVSKTIMSFDAARLAALTASLKLQSESQTPSFVSAVFETVKVAPNIESEKMTTIASAKTDLRKVSFLSIGVLDRTIPNIPQIPTCLKLDDFEDRWPRMQLAFDRSHRSCISPIGKVRPKAES